MWVRSLGWEDILEKGMATHSSILAWKNPMDRGAWWAIVCEVAKSWTQLKRLSMHIWAGLRKPKTGDEAPRGWQLRGACQTLSPLA